MKWQCPRCAHIHTAPSTSPEATAIEVLHRCPQARWRWKPWVVLTLIDEESDR